MLTCIWGGERYAWRSPEILALITLTVALGGGLALLLTGGTLRRLSKNRA